MQFSSWLRNLISACDFSGSNRTRRRPHLEPLEDRKLLSSGKHDVLDIGDASDNSIKQFDAVTGAYLGSLVAPGGGGLDGPRGLIFRNRGQLFVVNQNVDQNFSGEILRYYAQTGKPLSPVVPTSDPNAPFAPRGMVLKHNVLYVANVEGANSPEGGIAEYAANSGKFLGTLSPKGFTGQFNPRGVVFGPGGKLYVSVFDTTNPLVGYVLRFNYTASGMRSFIVVAANNGDGIDQRGETKDLHRPEGLVFGPHGNLYVTSFRADASDTDKILVFAGRQLKHVKDEVNLDQVGQPRAFAQAIAFGPGGGLFVPITGNGPDTGAVRRYDVTNDTYTNFVAPVALGGALGSPWYLTFGQTNPATLG